jgi:hypothetical protein
MAGKSLSRLLLSRTRRRLLKPETEVRRVTLVEKINNPEKFSLGGEYVVSKSVKKIGARTAFVTVSRRKDAIEGVSHGKAAKQYAAGEREYKTAASADQAAKTREVARIKRELRTPRKPPALTGSGRGQGAVNTAGERSASATTLKQNTSNGGARSSPESGSMMATGTR